MKLYLVTYIEYGHDWENYVVDSIWKTKKLAKERIDRIKEKQSEFSKISDIDYRIFYLNNEE